MHTYDITNALEFYLIDYVNETMINDINRE